MFRDWIARAILATLLAVLTVACSGPETMGRAQVEPAQLTLAQYLTRWLDFVAPGLAPSTQRRHRQICKRISAKLGGIKLQALAGVNGEQGDGFVGVLPAVAVREERDLLQEP